MPHSPALRPRSTSAAAVALAALALAGPAAAAGPPWGGDAELSAFHTSDLFPGGPTRETDDGLRLRLRPQYTFRLPDGLRLRPWAGWTGERYRTWQARDVDRWEFGVDLRRGPFRLRGAGGFTNHELYFPTTGGGVYLDRRHWTLEGRWEPQPGWMGQLVFTREHDDFIATYNERDDRRSTLRWLVERRFTPRARLAASYAYRHARSVTDLYTYAQNALRVEGEFDPGARLFVRGLGEFGLRDYSTGLPFALNFGREDDRWRSELAIGRALAGPLRAEVRGAWGQRTSTRTAKNYSVREYGLALTASY